MTKAVCEVAQTIARTSANELAALYHRIARWRGKGRAALVVAHVWEGMEW